MTRRLTRGLGAGGLAVLLAGTTACTGGPQTSGAAALDAVRKSSATGDTGPFPETLLEPPPVTTAERLALKSRRQTRFCDAMTALRDLPEPQPDDVDRMLEFAASYHSGLAGIDFKAELDPAQEGDKPVPLPAPLVTLIKREQAQLYAYRVRLAAIAAVSRDAENRKEDASGLVRERSQTAFVQLVNSTFTADDRVLREAAPRLCPDL